MEAKSILEKYWGYTSFRPTQEPIIQHVANGNDALALLPTGGGKSICFQVPALMMDGICIVISPLIALMKDQVNNLTSRGIGALAITSEHTPEEIDARFDRCIYDSTIKFLYLSPERLLTPMAEMRIKQMKVSLIAVDEAHCISEWGYDFRPSYLDIVKVRPWIPEVPLIALTASATKHAIKDIVNKLELNNNKKLFINSFNRENLAYFVEWKEDKIGLIQRIAQKQKGSGIIYMRSRKGTERISKALNKLGFGCDFYHAGLSTEERTERQEAWTSGKTPVIAATNAFGMGIDKPDVRFVIHLDIPDTLENYYQEAGRAGRDGEKAFAICLLTKQDLDRFKEKSDQRFPSKELIKRTYDLLCDSLKLAVGSGKDETFTVDLDRLAERHDLNTRVFEQSFSFLQYGGYLTYDDNARASCHLQFTADHQSIRALRARHDHLDRVIDAALRSYPRLFEESVRINPWSIAKRAHLPKDIVDETLAWLDTSGNATYQNQGAAPTIRFLKERIHTKNLRLSAEHYDLRKRIHQEKYEAMLGYLTHDHLCRSRSIASYFGETDTNDCGICDVCLSQKN